MPVCLPPSQTANALLPATGAVVPVLGVHLSGTGVLYTSVHGFTWHRVFSRFVHAVFGVSILLSGIPFHELRFFTPSSVEHLGCVHFSSITEEATMKVHIQVFT